MSAGVDIERADRCAGRGPVVALGLLAIAGQTLAAHVLAIVINCLAT